MHCIFSIANMIRQCSLLLFLLLGHSAHAEKRVLWQKLHDYRTVIVPEGEILEPRNNSNPFIAYTNIGTDYGYIGPAQHTIGWKRGVISMDFKQDADSWAGMWHSMSRLDRMCSYRMNFQACYPEQILPEFQPKVTGLRSILRGNGKWKIDLLDQLNKLLWTETRNISTTTFENQIYDLPAEGLTDVKHLSWVGEQGASLDLDQIDLRIETPDITFAEWLFLASYAKSLTCWSSETGLIRDRAHIPDGAFDSISASGLFCAATAAAASRGIVDHEFAKMVCRRALDSAKALRGPYGLLPHFVKMADGKLQRHPGTEYSTVDTALFCFGHLIACHALKEEAMMQEVLEVIQAIDFAPLLSEDGYISHGVTDEGQTIIPYYWKDWGGETALVLLLQAIAKPEMKGRMSDSGVIHQGTGFIIEIQSLLFPDFDADTPDAMTGKNWLALRREHLTEQQNHLAVADADGIFGLSAGESSDGTSYYVGGTELLHQEVLHPHYALMAAQIHENPEEMSDLLRNFEAQGAFTAWGMVENISLRDNEKLPMIGGLNATFEALGAYHFLCRKDGNSNVIYQSCLAIPACRQAMKIFYP